MKHRSSSYVSIPEDGGFSTITVTAQDNWTAEKVTTDKDEVEWLTLSTSSGSAGQTELIFSAPKTIDGRTAEVLIHAAGKTQRINVIQGLAVVSEASVSEVRSGPDGKTFLVSGVVTAISNMATGI